MFCVSQLLTTPFFYQSVIALYHLPSHSHLSIGVAMTDGTYYEGTYLLSSSKATRLNTPGESGWVISSLLFKSVVGTGILAFPPSFTAGGLVKACITALLMCYLTIYTMKILILTVRRLRREGLSFSEDGRIEYMDLANLSFHRWGLFLCALSLIVCQIGSVFGFVCFIYSNITAVFPQLYEWQVAVGLFFILAPLCLRRTTNGLRFSSSLGNVALLMGICTIYYYGCTQLHGGAREVKYWTEGGFSVLFGVCLFMFSAHAEVISIEQGMADKSKFLRVMTAVLVGIFFLYIQFGVTTYLFFGEATGMKWDSTLQQLVPGTLFDNIGAGHVINVVRLFMCVAITFQFPIVMLPAFICIEQGLGLDSTVKYEVDPNTHITVNVLRLLLLAAITGLGLVIPGFEFVVAFTGACSNGLIGFVFPPLFYWQICGDELAMGQKIFNWAVCLFGLIGISDSKVIIRTHLSSPHLAVIAASE
eukprot:g66905.t1